MPHDYKNNICIKCGLEKNFTEKPIIANMPRSTCYYSSSEYPLTIFLDEPCCDQLVMEKALR